MNAHDAGGLVVLADPDLGLDARGIECGHASVRSFVARQAYGAAQVITAKHIFARDDVAVVFGRTEYRSVDTGSQRAPRRAALCSRSPTDVYSPAAANDLQAALSEAGLDEHEDAVPV